MTITAPGVSARLVEMFSLGLAECRYCKEVLPVEDFLRDKIKPGGIRTTCKRCSMDIRNGRREPSKRQPRVRGGELEAQIARTGTKVCPRCKVTLPVSSFYRSPGHAGGLASWCKKCNVDRLASRPKSVRARRNRLTRAREAGVRHEPWTPNEIAERDRGICGLCGYWVHSSQREVDHIISISRGGADAPDNLMLTHLSGNRRKRDRTLDEYDAWLNQNHLTRAEGCGVSISLEEKLNV